MKKLFIIMISGMFLFVGSAFAGEKAPQKVVDLANEKLAKLGEDPVIVAAVKAADLVDTLKGEGPFTVFAPTDDAFAKLPEGTLDDLLKPENKDKLKSILTYHVVSGKVMAKDVATMKMAETVNGQSFMVSMEGDSVMVDNAKVVQTDIEYSNGVIHVIDSVILPK